MTIGTIGSQDNILQVLRAQNAFQQSVKRNDGAQKPVNLPKEDVKVSISSKNIDYQGKIGKESETGPVRAKNPYIEEVQRFASSHNINDIEKEEIEEALKYGTSLFADYTA